jgi:lipoprotein-anchoring transpeptidase ErfK/SrfK
MKSFLLRTLFCGLTLVPLPLSSAQAEMISVETLTRTHEARFSEPEVTGSTQRLIPVHAAPGQYGGGFIEFLMTGTARNEPSPVFLPNRSAKHSVLAQEEMRPDVSAPRSRRSRAHIAVLNQVPLSDVEEEPVHLSRAVPSSFRRQSVSYNGSHRQGTVIIDTEERFLYLIQSGGRALRYGIGVGRPGFEWAGTKTITLKREWPDWRPPAQMLKRRPDLPRYMAGGPNNPLGARALYLGSSLYRIHGTNEPHTIGQAVSSGCIRMTNSDVSDLYSRVRVGTRVIVR